MRSYEIVEDDIHPNPWSLFMKHIRNVAIIGHEVKEGPRVRHVFEGPMQGSKIYLNSFMPE